MLEPGSVLVLSAIAGFLAAPSAGAAVGEADLALVGVRVLTMSDPFVLDDRTLLVSGDRIAAIGRRGDLAVPDGARVIDGGGRIVMPGLVDAHIHLRDAERSALLDYLRAGVTTAREMNGRPFLLEWRDRIAAGDLVGPTLRVACPTIGNFSSPREGYPMPESAEEGRAAVVRFRDAGYDWIKIYTFLSREAFEGVMAAALEAGVPVGGHVPFAVGLEDALASGMRSVEHLTEYVGSSLIESERELDEGDFRSVFGAGTVDEQALEQWVRATAAARVWNVPTLVWFDHRSPAPVSDDAWADPALRRQGERNRRRLVELLAEHGAPLAVGTDSDAGDDEPASVIHDELEAWVGAGLDPRQVLRAATRGGAALLGLENEIGTIEPGRRADLLLLRCDPLESISCTAEIDLVIARGRAID